MKTWIILSLVGSLAFAGELSSVPGAYKYQDAPEYQAILSHLKSMGEFSHKAAPAPVVKSMSRGEQMVEEAKARNRARLKEMRDSEKKDESLTELEKWKIQEKTNLGQWKKESKDQLNAWKREQEIFLGRLKIYKENTFVFL